MRASLDCSWKVQELPCMCQMVVLDAEVFLNVCQMLKWDAKFSVMCVSVCKLLPVQL